MLDPSTLEAVDVEDTAITDLVHGTSAGTVTREFFASQVEHATSVCRTAEQALEELVAFRRLLGRWADERRVVAAGTATPPRVRLDAGRSPGERYARIARDIGGVGEEHQINGLHIHLGIADRDEGIVISNALRPWLPVLLAVSANSPFWAGRDTGFDSWRTVHGRRWTTFGIPPAFRDAAQYDAAVEALAGIGATSDAGTINWTVRLSRRHPTVEIRVCDAQLDPRAAVTLASLVRALAESASADGPSSRSLPGSSSPTGDDGPWDAALWHAARHGVRAELVHPLTGRLAPADRVLRALCARAAPHLADDAERRAVEQLLSRTLRGGGGSALQRHAYAAGAPVLAALYRTRLCGTPAGGCQRVGRMP